jgi:transcriptional regulator of arginine metabolism
VKFQRQLKILELIEKECIETQEELSERLKQTIGVDVTQATVSRDIKELRLVKVLNEDGTYHYTSSAKEGSANISSKFRIIFKESVIGVQYANNIIVDKTLAGMAQAAAAAIDGMNWPEIVGSLAGDDTIFLVLMNEATAASLTEELSKMLK